MLVGGRFIRSSIPCLIAGPQTLGPYHPLCQESSVYRNITIAPGVLLMNYQFSLSGMYVLNSFPNRYVLVILSSTLLGGPLLMILHLHYENLDTKSIPYSHKLILRLKPQFFPYLFYRLTEKVCSRILLAYSISILLNLRAEVWKVGEIHYIK